MVRDYSYDEIKGSNVIDGIQVWHVRETVVRRGNTAICKMHDNNGQLLCLVVLHDLKGQQGEGAYSGQELVGKQIPTEHKIALESILNDAEDNYNHDDLFNVIIKGAKAKDFIQKENSWKKTVAQLTNLGCWILDIENSNYRIDTEVIEEYLRKGEF